MIIERNGLRLKIENNKAVVGPMTAEGCLMSCRFIDPNRDLLLKTSAADNLFPPDWKTWLPLLEEFFCFQIDGDYETVAVKHNYYDGALVVAEFKKIEGSLADPEERVQW